MRNPSPAPLYFWPLWRPLLLGLALMRRPGLFGRPRVIHPHGLRLQWGEGRSGQKSFEDWSELPN